MEITELDLILGDCAVTALLQELEVYPKPGLVSPQDNGAHQDMDFELMGRSAQALRQPFAAIAAAGRTAQPFATQLIPLGLVAEREMMRATGGVNTHRGAIFTLGMLLAAMARGEALKTSGDSQRIRVVLMETWGDALSAHSRIDLGNESHGGLVHKTTGVGGARAEAARGFPLLFEIGLPAYGNALASGLDAEASRVQTLFALMEAAEDSNVVYRGGVDAALFVRRSASAFLSQGGCFSPGWKVRAEELHQTFIRRNISPGGCADLLAGTLLVAGKQETV